MFSHVDEFGRIHNYPGPEKRQEVSRRYSLGAVPIPEEETRKVWNHHFLKQKRLRFITEDRSKEKCVFFHQNNAREILKKGTKVSFLRKKDPPGFRQSTLNW